MGSDVGWTAGKARRIIFQSTLPGWGATLRGVRLEARLGISIHAPRMGSDLLVVSSISSQQFQSTLPGWGATGAMGVERRHERISIHAPRMGSDSAGRWVDITTIPFQSTLPGWGATHEATMYPLDSTAFQSTLPGWGATIAPAGLPHPCEISIHAPRMGSDGPMPRNRPGTFKFQSTLPGWGATG